MDYELSIDPLVICRCCLAEHSALKTVFCNEIVNGSILPFPKVFECVTGFKVTKNDGFPEKLCPVCRQLINDSYILQQKYKTNRHLLIGILKIDEPPPPDPPADRAKVVQVSACTQTAQPDSGHCASTQTEQDEVDIVLCTTKSTGIQTEDCAASKSVVVSVACSSQTERVSNARKHTQTVASKNSTVCTQTEESIRTKVQNSKLDVIMKGEKEQKDLGSPVTDEVIFELYTNEDNDEDDDDHESTVVEYLIDDLLPPASEDIKSTDDNDEVTIMPTDEVSIEHLDDDVDDINEEVDVVDNVEKAEDDGHLTCVYCTSEFNSFADLSAHLRIGCNRKRRTDARTTSPAKHAKTTLLKAKQTSSHRKRTSIASSIPQTQQQSFSCSLCSYNAKTDRDFGAHVHGHKRWLPTLLDSIYYFRCGNCLMVFLTAEDLETHRQQEAGDCRRFGIDDGDNDAEAPCTNYQFLDDEFAVDTNGGHGEGANSGGVSSGELDLEDPQLFNVAQRVCSAASVFGEGMNVSGFACDRCDAFVGETTADVWTHCSEQHFSDEALEEVVKDLDQELDEQSACLDAVSRFVESWCWAHKCGYCDKVFRTIRSAAAHVFFHANRFVCPLNGCSESYARYSMLGQHLDRVHHKQANASARRGQATFECGYCAQDYEAYADYRMHLRTECPGRQFVCKQCDKRFFSKHHLDIHMKYHQNVRRYKCQYCDKRFTQSGDQRIHERIHTGEKPFPCPYCPKMFRSIGNRKDHVATHDISNKVMCKVCGVQFKSERIMRGHMAIHSKEKRFKCTVCPKEFYRKYHLTQHMLTHQGIESAAETEEYLT